MFTMIDRTKQVPAQEYICLKRVLPIKSTNMTHVASSFATKSTYDRLC
jgi:hypothetical protein